MWTRPTYKERVEDEDAFSEGENVGEEPGIGDLRAPVHAIENDEETGH